MLAITTGELRLMVPPWGCVLLVVLGVIYLVFGSCWPRFFDVLSMTVVGCATGLVASAWVPLAPALVTVLGGIAVGGLTAFFRRVAHVVLVAGVLGGVLATFTGLAVGEAGFASYLVMNVSETTYSTLVSGPNLSSDAVLAAGLAGLLVGALVGVRRFELSERLVTSGLGSALVVFGVVQLVGACRSAGSASLGSTFPLTLAAAWACLAAIGVSLQSALGGLGPAEARSDVDEAED